MKRADEPTFIHLWLQRMRNFWRLPLEILSPTHIVGAKYPEPPESHYKNRRNLQICNVTVLSIIVFDIQICNLTSQGIDFRNVETSTALIVLSLVGVYFAVSYFSSLVYFRYPIAKQAIEKRVAELRREVKDNEETASPSERKKIRQASIDELFNISAEIDRARNNLPARDYVDEDTLFAEVIERHSIGSLRLLHNIAVRVVESGLDVILPAVLFIAAITAILSNTDRLSPSSDCNQLESPIQFHLPMDEIGRTLQQSN